MCVLCFYDTSWVHVLRTLYKIPICGLSLRICKGVRTDKGRPHRQRLIPLLIESAPIGTGIYKFVPLWAKWPCIQKADTRRSSAPISAYPLIGMETTFLFTPTPPRHCYFVVPEVCTSLLLRVFNVNFGTYCQRSLCGVEPTLSSADCRWLAPILSYLKFGVLYVVALIPNTQWHPRN